MKLGIMQPYFIPYIGYWQLLNAVDEYVIYDDVNFIKGGWINRNRILVDGNPKYFNIQMEGASPNRLINEVGVSQNEAVVKKNLRIIEAAYRKAPYFKAVFPLVESILEYDTDNLAVFLENSIRRICEYLEIGTKLIISSSIEKDCSLKAQEKVLDICKRMGADEYYNAIGGTSLYATEDFIREGVQLHFLKPLPITYTQFSDAFVENLSILDVMMFNSKMDVQGFMGRFELISQ